MKGGGEKKKRNKERGRLLLLLDGGVAVAGRWWWCCCQMVVMLLLLLLDDSGGSAAPMIRVITRTRWYRKKEEGNPDQIILQEFIALNYERLEVSNEIRQRAGEFYEILRQTDFPDVGSDLALAAIVYFATLDLESAYTFKELKISDMKVSIFFAMKTDIVEHLQGNEYSGLR